MRERTTECFYLKLVDAAFDSVVETGNLIDFGAYEERYAETTTILHLAGSLWNKKHPPHLIDVEQILFERYVKTVMTSMEPIPDEYRYADWIETHPEASCEAYERARTRLTARCLIPIRICLPTLSTHFERSATRISAIRDAEVPPC